MQRHERVAEQLGSGGGVRVGVVATPDALPVSAGYQHRGIMEGLGFA